MKTSAFFSFPASSLLNFPEDRPNFDFDRTIRWMALANGENANGIFLKINWFEVWASHMENGFILCRGLFVSNRFWQVNLGSSQSIRLPTDQRWVWGTAARFYTFCLWLRILDPPKLFTQINFPLQTQLPQVVNFWGGKHVLGWNVAKSQDRLALMAIRPINKKYCAKEHLKSGVSPLWKEQSKCICWVLPNKALTTFCQSLQLK